MGHHLTAALMAGACVLVLSTSAADPALATESSQQQPATQKERLKLSEAQQQAIIDAVVKHDTHQPTPKEFEPKVGAKITPKLDLHPLPRPLVYELEHLQQYMYAHLDQNIALIDPTEKTVVALIPLPEGLAYTGQKPDVKQAALNRIGGLAETSAEQRRAIYQAADAWPQQAPEGVALPAGAEAPAGMSLQPLPPQVAAQAPQVQGLHYAKLQDGRLLLIDPQTRKVAGVITQEEGQMAQQGGTPSETTGASGEGTRDPMREREESGKPSAYSGPTTTGPNTDER